MKVGLLDESKTYLPMQYQRYTGATWSCINTDINFQRGQHTLLRVFIVAAIFGGIKETSTEHEAKEI